MNSVKGTIIYIGNFELPDKGASANRAMNNKKLFNTLGYRVVVLGISNSNFNGVRRIPEYEDLYEQSYPDSVLTWFEYMVSMKSIQNLIDVFTDVRMIILYNMPYVLMKRCKSFFSNHNIRVCYDCTEWTTVTEGTWIKQFIKKIDCYFIQEYLPQNVDGLIVVSRKMLERYSNHPNLLYLPPLVDVTDLKWHQRKNVKHERFQFCFAGMLDGNKDSLDAIIRAFISLNNSTVCLNIIGPTKDEFLSFYPEFKNKRIESLESIVFMGKLSHVDTISYILNSDCNLIVRKADARNNAGFPTKFVEAVTCGKPIIASVVSNIKDYAEENCILIDSVDDIKIAEAMRKMLNNANRTKESSVLNTTFDYKQYIKYVDEWLQKMFAN